MTTPRNAMIASSTLQSLDEQRATHASGDYAAWCACRCGDQGYCEWRYTEQKGRKLLNIGFARHHRRHGGMVVLSAEVEEKAVSVGCAWPEHQEGAWEVDIRNGEAEELQKLKESPCSAAHCHKKGDYGWLEKEGRKYPVCADDYDKWSRDRYWDERHRF